MDQENRKNNGTPTLFPLKSKQNTWHIWVGKEIYLSLQRGVKREGGILELRHKNYIQLQCQANKNPQRRLNLKGKKI